MNTFLRSSLPVFSAFGVATVAGLLATLFWTPNAGPHNRRRLAAGLRPVRSGFYLTLNVPG